MTKEILLLNMAAAAVDWNAFVTEKLPEIAKDVETVTHTDITGVSGGLSSQLDRLEFAYKAGTTADEALRPRSLVVKRTFSGREEKARAMGTTREADFFARFGDVIDAPRDFLPRVFYTDSDASAGTRTIVMEDLGRRGGAQAGYFFGANSVLNWGKDLAALTAGFAGAGVDERAITLRCFGMAAQMHAAFWRDASILDLPFLRAGSWIAGRDRESFMECANVAIDGWKKFMAAPSITVDPLIVALMDNCIAKLDFDAYVAMWKELPYTAVHGDFHPGNMVVARSRDDGAPASDWKLMLLDYEAVGVGSGPQDLGQFAISHSFPEERRAIESEALAAYHAALVGLLAKKGVAAEALPSLEYVRREYVQGGLCRWAWLLGVIVSLGLPPPALTYFHNQVLAFCRDHAPNVSELGMLRP